MNKEEFKLIDKRREIRVAISRLDSERLQGQLIEIVDMVEKQDKKFIRLLKEDCCICHKDRPELKCLFCDKIDKLSGFSDDKKEEK